MLEEELPLKTMVYHAPYPLNRDAKSASGIRPVRMLEAFHELGYTVLEVTGTSAERKRSIRRVKEFSRGGGKIDFMYSECSTMPTALTDAHHLPLHPFLDACFFSYLKRQHVPIGVFYRDIYWKFAEYLQRVNRFVAIGTRAFYRFDLLVYRRWADRLYLPSLRMGDQVPHVRPSQHEALPPGCVIVDPAGKRDDDLTIFFVGGLGDYYRMHELMYAVGRVEGAHLILCTREDQWRANSADYKDAINSSVEIVHASGPELEGLFARASVCSLFLEPIEYREFASPLKLYEYIGHGRPIIASQGTLTGEFVETNGLGWSLPYSAIALSELLSNLQSDRAAIERISQHVRTVRHDHTWLARAKQVANGLTPDLVCRVSD